jgi:hypothetical protein
MFERRSYNETTRNNFGVQELDVIGPAEARLRSSLGPCKYDAASLQYPL